MSKIKVDTLEGFQNVKLAPNGTGVVEVKGAGGADGTLKLLSNNGSNGVTIKSPPHSAGQSQTIVLPDNNLTQSSFLKVKSVSGSTPNTVAQLEYATIAEPDLTNLNASNFTSGPVPAARFPSSFPGTTTGFKHIPTSRITSGQTVNQITVDWSSHGYGAFFFTGSLESTNQYSYIRFDFTHNTNGNVPFAYNDHWWNFTGNSNYYSTDGNGPEVQFTSQSYPLPNNLAFTGYLSTYDYGLGANTFMGHWRAFAKGYTGRHEAHFMNSWNNSWGPTEMTFYLTNGNFVEDSYFSLYKFLT